MTAGTGDGPDAESMRGTLVTVPSGTDGVETAVADEYRRLVDRHGSDEVLVLAGSPTSAATIRGLLRDAVPGAAVPSTTSVIVHATDVVGRTSDDAVLSDALRRELAHRFFEGYEWDHAYLRRASERPSFVDHVARLAETAVWQDATLDATPELVELGAAVDAFHDRLADHGHVERGQLIPRATAALERGDDPVDATAVLAVEFEEFRPVDRAYLRALADGRELICIAETDGSVRRTRSETGSIADRVAFARERRVAADPATRPAATAAYLARGAVPDDPGTGVVRVHAATTAADQFRFVADEVERLVDREGWAYDDVAVGVGPGGTATADAIRELERTGLPTESTTVTGFGDDPAVRELLAVVRYLAAEDDERADRLDAHPALDASLLDAVEATDGLAASLRRWATESGLKRRVAAGTPPLDARARFANVRRAFGMAAFHEDADLLEATWDSLATTLERAHARAPTAGQTSATDRDGGVRVERVRALKNGAYRAAFLVDVVDGVYPGDPAFTPLFPDDRVAAMPDYPGVSVVDDDAVDATFATDSTASSRPVDRYDAELARRLLAVGAAAATDRLYLCTYAHADAALGDRARPSRFLVDCYRTLPWVTEASAPRVESERAAESYLLSRVDRALDDVRRTRSRDVAVSLDAVEADLAEIQRLLAASGERGDRLREALRARVDAANGVVRRE